jgi:glycosyltransferase involved in cell wall biosynthesis
MPAYNEEGCIESVVRGWLKEFERQLGQAFRLIVVNDGSKDQTGRLLDALMRQDPRIQVIHQANGGHGVALLNGYRAAVATGAEYTFHVDSDDQFVPSDFSRIWSMRSTSKFLIGFRKVRHDAFHRLVITRILKFVVFGVFGVRIDDANVPFRLIKTSYLRALLGVLPEGIFAPNIFLAVLAAKDGQLLGGIPVTHEDRKTGSVSIVRWKLIQVCLRSTRELIDFRFSFGRRISSLRASKSA